MSKLITINTEKSIPSKKYKPPVFILLVASILIFSMLSTSVFADSVLYFTHDQLTTLFSLANYSYARQGLSSLTTYYTTDGLLYNNFKLLGGSLEVSEDTLDSYGFYFTPTNQNNVTLKIPLYIYNCTTCYFYVLIGSYTSGMNEVSSMYFYDSSNRRLDTSYEYTGYYNGFYLPNGELYYLNLYKVYYGADVVNAEFVDIDNLTVNISNPYVRIGGGYIGLLDCSCYSALSAVDYIQIEINQNLLTISDLLNDLVNIELEDQEQVSEIQQAMEELQNSIYQIGQDLNSIARPPTEDFDFDMDTVTDGKADFSAFNSDDSFFVEFFNDDLTGTMLKTVLFICSIGFILFGKR